MHSPSTLVASQAAYCTDKFLVVHSDGSPNHKTYLSAIPRPPGGGTGSYDSSCVTRTFARQWMTFKVPLQVKKNSFNPTSPYMPVVVT